jgi:hypothetical protein
MGRQSGLIWWIRTCRVGKVGQVAGLDRLGGYVRWVGRVGV